MRWDGRQWVSLDGFWAWNGNQWLQIGSNLPVAVRVAIYAAVGLLNVPIIFVLVLIWGLQGPGWATDPPDVIGSLVQIALTLGGAFVAFCAAWFLVRIDRRDWWLGAVFAWPWIASTISLLYGFSSSQPPDVGFLFIGAGLLLFAAFPLAGSIIGHSAQRSARLGRATRATSLFLRAFVSAAVTADSINVGLPMELPADVSGDGKFKWDGERWVPIETPQSEPQRHKSLTDRLVEHSQSPPEPGRSLPDRLSDIRMSSWLWLTLIPVWALLGVLAWWRFHP